jgi:hypothetical protein
MLTPEPSAQLLPRLQREDSMEAAWLAEESSRAEASFLCDAVLSEGDEAGEENDAVGHVSTSPLLELGAPALALVVGKENDGAELVRTPSRGKSLIREEESAEALPLPRTPLSARTQ